MFEKVGRKFRVLETNMEGRTQKNFGIHLAPHLFVASSARWINTHSCGATGSAPAGEHEKIRHYLTVSQTERGDTT